MTKLYQECIIINKNNIDIIGKALEEYWSYAYHDAHTINEINESKSKNYHNKKANREDWRNKDLLGLIVHFPFFFSV